MDETTNVTATATTTKPTGIYCIKCRDYTDNVYEREDVVTSKNKPRNVIKANCAVCEKKKNRFVKTMNDIEEVVLTETKPPKEKKVKVKKTAELEQLIQKFLQSQKIQ